MSHTRFHVAIDFDNDIEKFQSKIIKENINSYVLGENRVSPLTQSTRNDN